MVKQVNILNSLNTLVYNENYKYRIAGKFGGDNVWRIDSCKLFGKEKFGEWL